MSRFDEERQISDRKMVMKADKFVEERLGGVQSGEDSVDALIRFVRARLAVDLAIELAQ